MMYFTYMFRSYGLSGLVLLLLLIIDRSCDAVGLTGDDGLSELCVRCPGAVRNGSIVMRECESEGGEVVERCCVRRGCGDCSAVVIGLDWSSCNLTELKDYTFSDIGITLDMLDVSANDDLSNDSISSRAFGGLTNLTILSLPAGMECGDNVWSGSNSTENSTVCSLPVWPCEWLVVGPPEGGYNMSDDVNSFNVSDSNFTDLCPPNSHCVPDGPGLHQCLCSDGYHGYKCLLQGTFPYAAFFGSSVGGALVVMVIYWGMRISEKLRRT